MTIATTTNRVDVLGNGSATVFSFAPVVIFQAADLQVTLRDSAGNETALTQGAGSTNYSVSVVSYPGTGSINYPASGGTPLPAGSSLVIKRIVALLQNVALENQGAYFANVQEGAFDFACAIDQQQQEQINRTVQVAATDPAVPVTLPTSAARANKLLGFDSNGNPIAALSGGSAIVSSAMQPVVDAATTDAALTALGVSSAMAPVIKSGSLSTVLNTLAAAGPISSNPSIAFGPVGNAWATLGSIVQYGTTTSATLREFAGAFGLESYTGYGGVGPAGGIRADKVALYAGIEGFANSADTWALNILNRQAAGFPAGSNALGLEIDFNNEAQAVGAADGIAGLAQPIRVGLLVTGASTFGSSAGISVQGASNTQWYRGLGVASGVSEAAFYDYSSATTGIEMQATHVGWGIDMNGSALGGAIRVPNNAGIYARNAAGSADVSIADVDAANNLLIGVASGGGAHASGIYAGAGIVPFTDNTYPCGSGSNRWTSIFAVNGTINTSDPRDKRLMAALPPVGDVIDAVNPITFKWKIGGYANQPVVETRTVQDSETVEEDSFDIVVKDGTATRVATKKTVTRLLWDEVPLLDEQGKQVVVHVKAKPPSKAIYNADGVLLRPAMPAQPAVDVPQTHRIPRMVTKPVPVSAQVEVEGKRTHAGFSADDIGRIAELLGLDDFGGFVVDEQGKKHIRPDQLIPILWKGLQEERARGRALQTDVAALMQKAGLA